MLHLVQGDSAVGALREARARSGLAGDIVGIPEDLTHGPLDDGAARIAYMKACFAGYADWELDIADAFEPWRALVGQLGADDPVTVWTGANVSEYVFLRLACWWLRDFAGTVSVVDVPMHRGAYYVALQSPEVLATLADQQRRLEGPERVALADAFEAIRVRPETLRRYEAGALRFVPADHYDDCLLASCPGSWLSAARVVGDAMVRCGDGHNRLSDLLLSSRLQRLIDTGRVDCEGERRRLRQYRVRRAA